MSSTPIRHDWTLDDIHSLYRQPLLDLIFQAATIHRQFHHPRQIQVCYLISVKTGGCPEDCKYCPQSSRYQTSVSPQAMMSHEEVIAKAKQAIDKGATRICLGAAWREVRQGKPFDSLLSMVSEINTMGAEVCCTFGLLQDAEAERLAEAGCYAYNHNLDTSAAFYKEIITTRTYEERLQTLNRVEKAGMTVCCGGIIGMGETEQDRLQLLHTLATRPKHPESVPINMLIPIKGTPLEFQPKVPIWDFIRMIATARILMPQAMVRLSAGRIQLQIIEQALCFLAGANSIHSGEKLLTTPNADFDIDEAMFSLLGLQKLESFSTSLQAQGCHASHTA